MTGPKDDATKNKAAAGPEDGLSPDQVATYLKSHPDFLSRNTELLREMTLPSRWQDGDGVVDMQHYILDQLRGEIDNLRTCAQEVIETSRHNMSNQTRTHAAILTLIGASDFENLSRLINDDLPPLLDLEMVTIGFEPADPPLPDLSFDDIQRLPQGTVEGLLGESDVRLIRDMTDDGILFGSGAGLIGSAAIARLRPGRAVPVGLLSLGSRGSTDFHPGQGTELIGFLARIVERFAHKWLEPDS